MVDLRCLSYLARMFQLSPVRNWLCFCSVPAGRPEMSVILSPLPELTKKMKENNKEKKKVQSACYKFKKNTARTENIITYSYGVEQISSEILLCDHRPFA